MKNRKMHLLILACAVFAGCTKTVSISHSGGQPQGSWGGHPRPDSGSDPAFDYKGELSEFDVLGITRNEITSEAEIGRALDDAKRVKLRRDSSILLIQSGALFPDGPMVAEMGKHFTVVPFSGVPPLRAHNMGAQMESLDPESYSKSLRLAAARGGTDIIMCYWGMLESESENLATKTVSWLPVVNWMLPDEKQHMRIRLKVALVDVRSGNWAVFSPRAFEDQRISTSPHRGAMEQRQVEHLKKVAYEASAKQLVRTYSDVVMSE